MRTVRIRHKTCLLLTGVLLFVGITLLYTTVSSRNRHLTKLVHSSGPVNSILHARSVSDLSNHSGDVLSLVHSAIFKTHGYKLKWIAERITRMSSTWSNAYKDIKKGYPNLFASPKKILVLPGLLTEYSAYDFAENAYKGGYLGELIQWSDLIAGLYLLNSNLTIATSIKSLKENFTSRPDLFDLIITDYIGLTGLHVANMFAMYKCKIRIVDSFGTEPSSVFRTYNHSDPDISNSFSTWNFEHFKQFWTYYPHTPDNSFLGTVMTKPAVKQTRRRNQGLIYGKSGEYMLALKGYTAYLNTIGEYMELHSTFQSLPSFAPKHIVNHGVLPQPELQELLQSSKLFIGLGFPYDGPGALEALANGCPFIQPKFNPPLSKQNHAFFKNKPTSREVTSQHPYLEHFVGEPYVYTVDAENFSSIREAVMCVLKRGDLEPFIPYELTAEGFLKRLGSMILYEDFCDGEDLAVKKKATAGSAFSEHHPGEAVDGLLNHQTCWWSNPSLSSWWSVDLETNTFIRKIRIYNSPATHVGLSWQAGFLCPFQVSLLTENGKEVSKKIFTSDRAVHIWDDVFVLARHVHIESLHYEKPKYMVLCGVEVYGGLQDPPVWPDIGNLVTKVSNPGENCKDSCISAKMVCEPVYFKHLNTALALKKTFECTNVVNSVHFADYFPGMAVDDVKEHSIKRHTCVINHEPMLLSCAGRHQSYQRLCPCRHYSF